jgi:hypothetical protein
MSTASYKRDPIEYRREVMMRTAAAATGYSWSLTSQPFADFILTKRGTSRDHFILVKVYECMSPGTGDLCIDAAEWAAGTVAAQALGCAFAVLRRTPDGVQMMVHGVDNDDHKPELEVTTGFVEVRVLAEWFGLNVQLPNGQTWQHLKAD